MIGTSMPNRSHNAVRSLVTSPPCASEIESATGATVSDIEASGERRGLTMPALGEVFAGGGNAGAGQAVEHIVLVTRLSTMRFGNRIIRPHGTVPKVDGPRGRGDNDGAQTGAAGARIEYW